MAKDIGMTIRKGIVVSCLPCLVAFWGFHPYMFFHFFKCFFCYFKIFICFAMEVLCSIPQECESEVTLLSIKEHLSLASDWPAYTLSESIFASILLTWLGLSADSGKPASALHSVTSTLQP